MFVLVFIHLLQSPLTMIVDVDLRVACLLHPEFKPRLAVQMVRTANHYINCTTRVHINLDLTLYISYSRMISVLAVGQA